MAPTIHLVRHAQGHHNVPSPNQYSLPDPLLTPLGESQCAHLQHTFLHHSRITLIVASPLKRTLQTALLSFSDIIKRKNMQVIALPELQETSDMPCDTGSPLSELKREFAGKPVDWRLVTEGWDSKKGRWAPTDDAIGERAKEARKWLAGRIEGKEGEVVVVTHGGTGWANTEFRTYTFNPSTLPPNTPTTYSLIETPESRARRARTKKFLGEAERRNLENTAEHTLEKEVDGADGVDGEKQNGVKEEVQVKA